MQKKDLNWSHFLRALERTDDHSSPSSGIVRVVTTLTKLWKGNQKRGPSRKWQSTPWWTSCLVIRRSRLNALKWFYHRIVTELNQWRKHRQRAHFRCFITEELTRNRLGVACSVIKGKWRKKVSERLIISARWRSSDRTCKISLPPSPWSLGEYIEQDRWLRHFLYQRAGV